MALRHWLERIRGTRRRFGIYSAAQATVHDLINRLFLFERLDFNLLQRGWQKRVDSPRLSTRLATAAELEEMAKNPIWQIGPDKLANFSAGDQCILSFVDDKLAGCSWANARGTTNVNPHLSIALPENHLYSYAGITHPQYRGMRQQSLRHCAMLAEERWRAKAGLINYTSHTNFASRAAQRNSGFRRVGSLWLIGTSKHFIVLRSPGARALGLRRMRTQQAELLHASH